MLELPIHSLTTRRFPLNMMIYHITMGSCLLFRRRCKSCEERERREEKERTTQKVGLLLVFFTTFFFNIFPKVFLEIVIHLLIFCIHSNRDTFNILHSVLSHTNSYVVKLVQADTKRKLFFFFLPTGRVANFQK